MTSLEGDKSKVSVDDHGSTRRRADWALALDAATERRSRVLASESLESMWSIGRRYQKKAMKVEHPTNAVAAIKELSPSFSERDTYSFDKRMVDLMQGPNRNAQSTSVAGSHPLFSQNTDEVKSKDKETISEAQLKCMWAVGSRCQKKMMEVEHPTNAVAARKELSPLFNERDTSIDDKRMVSLMQGSNRNAQSTSVAGSHPLFSQNTYEVKSKEHSQVYYSSKETLSEAVKNTEARLKWSNSRPDMEKRHLAKSNQTMISSESLNARKNQEDEGSGPSSHGEVIYAQKISSRFSDDEEPTIPSESTTATLLSSLELSDQATELKTLEDVLADANAKPARLSYPFIKSITRNFSVKIGGGGFGTVYLGYLRTEKVAVKKLDIRKGFSDTIFAEEINCLMRASTKHHNVVRFLGYCADTHGEFVPLDRGYVMSEVPQRLLCFEYVPNGNLEKHLKDKSHKDEWKIRYRMIRGICHGLNSLHGQRINHLDLKPDNILLDACMNPKITDLGISRCFDEGISEVHTETVRGTPGSIAPEMIVRGEITFKSDIYGLGIIITKLLTGCNKYDFENWHTSIDVDGPQVKICTEIAQKCLSFDPHERPAISEIIKKLDEAEWL